MTLYASDLPAWLVALTAFASITLIATAPATVMVPILVTLTAGLAASVLVVKGDEWIVNHRGRRPLGGRVARPGHRSRSNALHALGSR